MEEHEQNKKSIEDLQKNLIEKKEKQTVTKDQQSKFTTGDQVSFKDEKGNYHIGMVLEDPETANLIVETWNGNEKEKMQINDEQQPRLMRGKQKFDTRELHFPFLGKSFDDMKSHFPLLLYGKKTKVIEGLQKKEDGKEGKTVFDGKIMLVRNPYGKPCAKIFEKKEKLEIADKIMGVTFTPEMKKALFQEGHLGLVRGFEKGDNKFNAYVSVDPELNTLAFLNEKTIKVSQNLKGKKLTEQERKDLQEGREVMLKGMKNYKGDVFSAKVRINAATQTISFTKPDANKLPEKHTTKQVERKTKLKH